MIVKHEDYNHADTVIAADFSEEYAALEGVLQEMCLQMKESDQAGIQGQPIFDPVGTNAAIKEGLEPYDSFTSNHRIPGELTILGTDIDFVANGMIVEVQFSNYPFLLNNLLRSELFYKTKVKLPDHPAAVAVIVTKAGMFKASNSTLYYEQALSQLAVLSKHGVFDVPVRLVGLFESLEDEFEACFNQYGARYSRVVSGCNRKRVKAVRRTAGSARCDIVDA